jgi:hypothetical protein
MHPPHAPMFSSPLRFPLELLRVLNVLNSCDTGAYSLRVTHKHAYKIQLLLDRQIGFHYYEQVSGSSEVMAGTDETPGQAKFGVRVNQKKVPSLPKGDIVIGNANAAPDGATGSGQGSGGGDGPA